MSISRRNALVGAGAAVAVAGVPEPGPEDRIFDPEVLVRRLYHDIARLAGEARS